MKALIILILILILMAIANQTDQAGYCLMGSGKCQKEAFMAEASQKQAPTMTQERFNVSEPTN